jgi:opacity protein-like surface antigen
LQEITMNTTPRATMTLATLATLAATCLQPAYAADQVLEFRLVTRNVDVKMIEAKNIEGQSVGVGRAHGVAYFKDGRIASKDHVFNWDYNKGAGPFSGYSTYTFEDGSTITARFTGNARPPGPARGEYTVLSGTGSFAGVKGIGTFETMLAKFPDAVLWNGKFSLAMP